MANRNIFFSTVYGEQVLARLHSISQLTVRDRDNKRFVSFTGSDLRFEIDRENYEKIYKAMREQ